MATSTVPLFGRQYSLIVNTLGGDTIELANSSWELEALHITFNIQLTALATTTGFHQ